MTLQWYAMKMAWIYADVEKKPFEATQLYKYFVVIFSNVSIFSNLKFRWYSIHVLNGVAMCPVKAWILHSLIQVS